MLLKYVKLFIFFFIIKAYFVSKTQKYKYIIMISEYLGMISVMLIVLSLYLGNFPLLIISSMCIGFFSIPVVPITFELGCEITHPIGESFSTGYLYMMSFVSSFILLLLLSLIDKG